MSSQPWDRQRKDGKLESARWFARFTLHRQSGPERSLLGTFNKDLAQKGANKRTSVPSSWFKASKYWNWDQRSEAWDAAELVRKDKLFRQQGDEWATNRFEDAKLLRKKARDILAFPVLERTDTDDKGFNYIIKPLPSTNARAAVVMLEAADRLARTTTRETLPKTETDITTDGKPFVITYAGNVDPDEL